jgi:hypothetical protein
MFTPDHKQIAESWLTIQRHWWAYDAVRHLCESEPKEALALILVMVEMADQPLLLKDIRAGPLEDLLVKRGADVIAEVEARARDNAPLRTVLSHVWISDGSGALNQRLVALGCRVVPIRPRDDA